MLYRDDFEACCAYCLHGRTMGDGEVFCERRGVVKADGNCRHYQYDPLRRVPNRPAVLAPGSHDKEDFTL